MTREFVQIRETLREIHQREVITTLSVGIWVRTLKVIQCRIGVEQGRDLAENTLQLLRNLKILNQLRLFPM
ncbi:hypothetical protein BLL37_26890 [Pseudomonas azotoformans]|uniref:Uncharacterized protein n=1 Tax=Pseudomonas azotoformans TaxID=47878 RepID=A0A1V2J674_PSEAZ|nr:hypothetical protein BFL39_08210 [Pseudomonas azotoformans]ONH40923.1 hypothetical protein BLL37_26890 [Pseudomonas azotoformans]